MLRMLMSFFTSRVSISLISICIIYAQLTYFKLKFEYFKHKLDLSQKRIKTLKFELSELETQLKYLQSKLNACEVSKSNLEAQLDKIIKQKDTLISRIVELHQENVKLKKYKKIDITNTSVKLEVNPDDKVSRILSGSFDIITGNH